MSDLYDPECLALAEHFMADAKMSDERRQEETKKLATEIQCAVEHFFAREEIDP